MLEEETSQSSLSFMGPMNWANTCVYTQKDEDKEHYYRYPNFPLGASYYPSFLPKGNHPPWFLTVQICLAWFLNKWNATWGHLLDSRDFACYVLLTWLWEERGVKMTNSHMSKGWWEKGMFHGNTDMPGNRMAIQEREQKCKLMEELSKCQEAWESSSGPPHNHTHNCNSS